jgi:cytochrome c553
MLKKITVFTALLLLSSQLFANDKAKMIAMGKQLGAACQACHGLGGKGKQATPYVPRIDGQHSQYILSQIKLYKTGERKGGMAAHMKIASDMFTEKQYEAIALYFESLER